MPTYAPSPPTLGSVPAANQALRLVEGSGLFCFLHDDVALHPDAIRELVEELYRSNAGIVGPKLVSWDDSRILQHVGLGIDRFGEVDPFVEPGEMDQEQHDAVRDVFCLPSACLLVRADLFRTLEGFHPGIEFYGDDLDLCWRAHLSGARVLVVPAAVARHQERLPERRPDLRHRGLAARNRLQNVATLTGRWRTPLVLLQSLVLAMLQTVVGLVTGRFRNGVASFVATLGVLPRLPSVLARRRSVKPLRLVPDREVLGLQVRGSARLALFMRQHQRVTEHVADGAAPVVRSGSRVPLLLALVLGAVLIIGSRGLIRTGIPDIGQFVDVPLGKDALHRYFVGWNGQGFGSAAAPATGLALLGFASSLSFGQLGFLQLVLVIGPIAVGYLGAWRMVAFFPSVRARAGAVIVYAAVPLPYAAVAAGRWNVLVVYAATPWAIYLICRVSGLTTVDGRAWGDDDIADAVVDVSLSRRITHLAALTLLAAVVAAFVPAFLLVVLLVAGALVLGTVLARGSWSIFVGAAMAALAVVGAVLLNLPWSAELLGSDGWGLVADPELAGPRNLGILNLASFRIGHTVLGSLALGLYLPVLAAPLIARGWRLTWAARAGALTAGIGLLVVLEDGGALPFRLPEAGILLVPVACGLALAGACAIAAFEHDIRGRASAGVNHSAWSSASVCSSACCPAWPAPRTAAGPPRRSRSVTISSNSPRRRRREPTTSVAITGSSSSASRARYRRRGERPRPALPTRSWTTGGWWSTTSGARSRRRVTSSRRRPSPRSHRSRPPVSGGCSVRSASASWSCRSTTAPHPPPTRSHRFPRAS